VAKAFRGWEVSKRWLGGELNGMKRGKGFRKHEGAKRKGERMAMQEER
jgi:hypothetical protein